jgi:hypothetical protein
MAEVDAAYAALVDALQKRGDLPIEFERVKGWLGDRGHSKVALDAAEGRLYGSGLVKRVGETWMLKEFAPATADDVQVEVVRTPIATSQRERLETILRVGRELQEKGERTFNIEELLVAVGAAGVERGRAMAIIQTLRNQGEIIEPRPGRFQLVRF